VYKILAEKTPSEEGVHSRENAALVLEQKESVESRKENSALQRINSRKDEGKKESTGKGTVEKTPKEFRCRAEQVRVG